MHEPADTGRGARSLASYVRSAEISPQSSRRRVFGPRVAILEDVVLKQIKIGRIEILFLLLKIKFTTLMTD